MSTINLTTHPWWKDIVCYQIWPMSFMDSNGDGLGDIQGVISKLDYLKDLGVDAIWLCPTYQSPMKDYGYDVSNYQDINHKFGTLADMEQLIEQVHKRGMKMLLDLVITHTSNEHPWFLESKSSKDNPKSDWYIWKDSRPGFQIANPVSGSVDAVEEPTNYRACFGGSVWTHAPERDQWYMHLFLVEEPDLNWENEEAKKAIFDSAIGFWLDRGVDGFRIDTVNRLSKDWSFQDAPVKIKGKLQPAIQFYINGPKSHTYLQEMRKYMDNHPRVKEKKHNLMIVGELPRTPFEDVLRYTLPERNELSMVFDFDMVNLSGHDDPDETKAHEVKNLCDDHESFTLPLFKETLCKVQGLIKGGAWATVFMENHDQCRSIARYATPDPQYHDKAAKLLCMMQTTLSGTQFIYQGQEIGMIDMPSHWDYDDFRDPGAKMYVDDEFKAGGSVARENAVTANLKFGRDNCRLPVQWTSGPNAGFSECAVGKTWIGVHPTKDTINVEDQRIDQDSIWHFWRRQIQLRKDFKELFMHGAFECLDFENKKTFTYLKTSNAEKVDNEVSTALVCLNFSDGEQVPCLPQRLLDGKEVFEIVSNYDEPHGTHAKMRAWEGRIYFLEEVDDESPDEHQQRDPTDAELEIAIAQKMLI